MTTQKQKRELQKRLDNCRKNKEEILDISCLNLTKLPDELIEFEWLKVLYCYRNELKHIIATAGLTQLTDLHCNSNEITDLSPIANLTKLQVLDCCFNKITDISTLANLTELTELYMAHNKIQNISPLGKLTNLTRLTIAGNSILEFSVFSKLPKLINYDIILPSTFGKVTMATKKQQELQRRIDIANANNKEITMTKNQQELQRRLDHCRTLRLEALNLSNLQLTKLPAELAEFTWLRNLFIDNNEITDLSLLAGLTRLELLHWYNNPIVDFSPLCKAVKLRIFPGLNGSSFEEFTNEISATVVPSPQKEQLSYPPQNPNTYDEAIGRPDSTHFTLRQNQSNVPQLTKDDNSAAISANGLIAVIGNYEVKQPTWEDYFQQPSWAPIGWQRGMFSSPHFQPPVYHTPYFQRYIYNQVINTEQLIEAEVQRRLAIGQTQSPESTGVTSIYRLNNNRWVKLTDLSVSSQPGDYFGWSVASDEEGEVIAVGAPYATVNGLKNAGAVYIFARSKDNKYKQKCKLVAFDAKAGDLFGNSVSISANGDKIAIGSKCTSIIDHDVYNGAVYIMSEYQAPPIKLIARLPLATSYIADSVYMNASGNKVLVNITDPTKRETVLCEFSNNDGEDNVWKQISTTNQIFNSMPNHRAGMSVNELKNHVLKNQHPCFDQPVDVNNNSSR